MARFDRLANEIAAYGQVVIPYALELLGTRRIKLFGPWNSQLPFPMPLIVHPYEDHASAVIARIRDPKALDILRRMYEDDIPAKYGVLSALLKLGAPFSETEIRSLWIGGRWQGPLLSDILQRIAAMPADTRKPMLELVGECFANRKCKLGPKEWHYRHEAWDLERINAFVPFVADNCIMDAAGQLDDELRRGRRFLDQLRLEQRSGLVEWFEDLGRERFRSQMDEVTKLLGVYETANSKMQNCPTRSAMRASASLGDDRISNPTSRWHFSLRVHEPVVVSLWVDGVPLRDVTGKEWTLVHIQPDTSNSGDAYIWVQWETSAPATVEPTVEYLKINRLAHHEIIRAMANRVIENECLMKFSEEGLGRIPEPWWSSRMVNGGSSFRAFRNDDECRMALEDARNLKRCREIYEKLGKPLPGWAYEGPVQRCEKELNRIP